MTLKFLLTTALVLCATLTQATVKPSIEYMAKKSDLVVIARVKDIVPLNKFSRMEHDKENRMAGRYAADTRSVTLSVDVVLKGTLTRRQDVISFIYHRMGKGNINFKHFYASQEAYVFFLKRLSDQEYELSDAWFGVEAVTPETLKALKEAEKAE